MDKKTQKVLLIVGIIVLFIFLSNNNLSNFSVYRFSDISECDNLKVGDCFYGTNTKIVDICTNCQDGSKTYKCIITTGTQSCSSDNECLSVDSECTSDSQCCSNICWLGASCKNPLPLSDYCSRDKECASGKCVNTYCVNLGPGPPECTSKTCTQLSKNCGWWDNGCGSSINCGSCSSGYHCSYTGQCNLNSGCNSNSDCDSNQECVAKVCVSSSEGTLGNGNPLTISELLSSDSEDIVIGASCSSSMPCNQREGYTVACDTSTFSDNVYKENLKGYCESSSTSTFLKWIPLLGEFTSSKLCEIYKDITNYLRNKGNIGLCVATSKNTFSKYYNSILKSIYMLGIPAKWVMPILYLIIILGGMLLLQTLKK